MCLGTAVVPGYYLVCYNFNASDYQPNEAVVPGYYLVCYNNNELRTVMYSAVVPGYYLVCYNLLIITLILSAL